MQIRYTTRSTRRANDAYLDDPIDEPPIIAGSFVTQQSPVTSDKDGEPVVNSAKDQFEGLVRDRSQPTLQITQNFALWNITQHIAFVDSVNSGVFFGQPARTVKLNNIRTTQEFRGDVDVPFYRSTFEFVAASA